MTKSFEVSIAIMFLLSFVFFVMEIQSNEYKSTAIPENTKTLLLLKAQDTEFRELVNNKDSENVYRMLFNDIEQEFVIKICDKDNCVLNNKGTLKYKRELEYYFSEIDKTLSVCFTK